MMNTKPKSQERIAGMIVLSVILLVIFTAIHDVTVSAAFALMSIVMVLFVKLTENYWNK